MGMIDIFDFQKRIKKKREKKEAEAQEQNTRRMDDLFIKFYEYNEEIKIPIPNLFADQQITKKFGGLEKVNFDDSNHIAWLLFILRNQNNGILNEYTEKQKEAAVQKILQEIPVAQKEHYQQAIYEMFLALKKNSIRRTKDILLAIKTFTEQVSAGRN